MSPLVAFRLRVWWHVTVLVLLVGGFFLAQTRAEESTPAVPVQTLLDRWLSPDVIIGGAVVLLYMGEVRGDLRRLKEDQADLAKRLHDDFIPRREVEALLGRRASDRDQLRT